MRAAALDPSERSSPDAVRQALLAHMCRCTGWHPIVESISSVDLTGGSAARAAAVDPIAAERRAALEGGVPQQVGPSVALGRGGFADDTAPPDALVAVRGTDADWVVGESLAEARRLSGKVQGTANHGAAGVADRGAPRRLEADAPDHVGRTGVSRA